VSTPAPGRWLLVAAAVVIVAAVAGAIAVIGTPGTQRQLRMDDRRVDDLRQIEAAAREYRKRTGTLPEGLDVLVAQPGVALSIADPETAAPYGYRRLAGDRFSLCAVFATDTAVRRDDRRQWTGTQWAHGAGRHCFERVGGAKQD
jgi:type II secretory pathway pseudopilin PulG